MNDDLRLMYKLLQDALYASYIKNDDDEVEKVVDKMDDLIYKKYTKEQQQIAKIARQAWLKQNEHLFKDKND